MQAEALLDHADFLRDLARSLTFGDEDPDDVVQQTWLATIESPPKGGEPGRGWLATVARNAVRQSRRSRGRRVAREATAPARKPIPTPDEIREREETRREVVDAVLDLGEPYRTTVILRYYEDLPPRAIAERLEIPVETVKTRLVRARKQLRARLDERHGGDGKRWGAALLLAGGDEVFEVSPAPVALGLPLAVIGVVLVAVTAGVVTLVSVLGSGVDATPPEKDRVIAVAPGDEEPAPESGIPAAPEEVGPDAAGKDREPDAEGGASGGRTGASSGRAVVDGRVFDEATRESLAGIEIVLRVWGKPFEMRRTLTDAEGRYRFADVPAGVDMEASVGRKGRYLGVARHSRRLLKPGETFENDLAARRQVGIDLRLRFVLPDGVEPPEEIRVRRASESDDPVRPNAAVDGYDVALPPGDPVIAVFLPVGTHRLSFEAPGLWGKLPTRRVEGDGPTEELSLPLRGRGPVLLRLVDARGGRAERAGVKIVPSMLVRSTDAAGNTNFSVEGLDGCSSDARGEADLTEILPAPNPSVFPGASIRIALEGDGIYRGGMGIPNFTITLTELARRVAEAGPDPVVIEVPAVPTHPLPVLVVAPSGEPVAGVHVKAEPAQAFARADLVSDANGKLTFELLEDEVPFHLRPRDPRTGRPAPVARRVFRAAAPWTGETGLVAQDGGPARLVVRKSRNLVFEFLDGDGNPLRNTEIRIAWQPAKTDAEGKLPFEPHPRLTEIPIQAPGHLPVKLDATTLEGAVPVRLERGRELKVSPRDPDGKPFYKAPMEFLDAGNGTPCDYAYLRIEMEAGALVYVVPLGAVKIVVRKGEWRAEVLAGAEVGEVVLELKPR